MVKPNRDVRCPIPSVQWRSTRGGTFPAAHPIFFPLFNLLSFPGDKKRMYAVALAHVDSRPGRLGVNSTAQTHFSKQNVEFLVACGEERFLPSLFGCAVCSWVPYERVVLSTMGRKLWLRDVKRRNFHRRESPGATIQYGLDFHHMMDSYSHVEQDGNRSFSIPVYPE